MLFRLYQAFFNCQVYNLCRGGSPEFFKQVLPVIIHCTLAYKEQPANLFTAFSLGQQADDLSFTAC